MKKVSRLILVAVTLGFVSSSIAFAAGEHDDHKPRFGGLVVEGKAFDVELVAKADVITVYLSEHGKPMSAKGSKGKITLLSGSEKVDAELLATADGKLEAKGKFLAATGTKAVLTVTPENKAASMFRFTLK
jgi:hypothetical protein